MGRDDIPRAQYRKGIGEKKNGLRILKWWGIKAIERKSGGMRMNG